MSASPEMSVQPEDVDLGILDETLSFFIRTLNIAVSRDLDQRLEGLDVARGTGKVTTLLLVERHPGIRSSVIAEMTLRDRSAMGRLLDDLESHGLLTRKADPIDSRAQGLFLTAKGHDLARRVDAIVGQSREFFADMDDEEYRQVITLLRRIYWRNILKRPGGEARR